MKKNIQTGKTYSVKASEIERDWWVIDAEGQTLGRLASRIAPILRGKHKPTFSPHLDVGDYVIVINCDKIEVTGNRLIQKQYYRHSGYPGGMNSLYLWQMLEKHPERPIEFAVKGMMPKGALGRAMLKKLKVYAGSDHPHEAQKPKTLEL